MGWWNDAAKGPKVLLGDEPMDLVFNALAAVSRSYLDDVGRKPTLEEFRRTLMQTLGTDPGQFFADMESAVVGDVVFRLKKVPKRQAFAVGDAYMTLAGAGNEQLWQRCCKVLERPDLIDDRFLLRRIGRSPISGRRDAVGT